MPQEQEFHALAQRILVKAAQKLGGAAALAKFLGVSEATLGEWIAGKDVPPAEVILKAVVPLTDEPALQLASVASERPASSQ